MDPSPAPADDHSVEPPPPPRVDFDQLRGDAPLVLIEYQGQVYQLRATRNGGLILNK